MILVFTKEKPNDRRYQNVVFSEDVLKLKKPLTKNAGFKIFAENCITSVSLIEKLVKDGLFSWENQSSADESLQT